MFLNKTKTVRFKNYIINIQKLMIYWRIMYCLLYTNKPLFNTPKKLSHHKSISHLEHIFNRKPSSIPSTISSLSTLAEPAEFLASQAYIPEWKPRSGSTVKILVRLPALKIFRVSSFTMSTPLNLQVIVRGLVPFFTTHVTDATPSSWWPYSPKSIGTNCGFSVIGENLLQFDILLEMHFYFSSSFKQLHLI